MKNCKYIVLSVLLSWTLATQARMYVAGEEVWLDAMMSDGIGDWSKDGAELFLYFYQSSDGTHNEWVTLSPSTFGSKVFRGTMASYHGWYDKVIVVRGTSASWKDVWNQTCSIDIPDNAKRNYLHVNDCSWYDNKWNWYSYAPAAEALLTASSMESNGVTLDNISICESAWGEPFSLRVKLNGDKTAYNYSDVHSHGWYYSTDGLTWTAVEPGKVNIPADDLDGTTDLNENMLPAKPLSGEIYYYLHSSLPSGRRLIHLTTDAPKCDLDCSITSFETAVSNVNADDNTYTLDGIVAFGIPNGSLVISCDGKSVTIPSPESPQAFTLEGLPATSLPLQTTTVTASFTGDASCTRNILITVPNVVDAVEIIRKDILTGDAITLLSPTAESDNDYVWVDEYNVEHPRSGGTEQAWTIPASRFSTDETVNYTYREYYNLTGEMDDLMTNGKYEASTGYGSYGAESTMSDYDFWGYLDQTATTPLRFYNNIPDGINPDWKTDNGFAVVCNAHNFYPTYAAVTARQGNNFALFDAKTGAEGGNKKAWYATTADNPKLKLRKGTTYVLSFWAANINNYGEMDNAARFKFYVEDITDPLNPVRIDSSEVLDLSLPEFRNNIWHQCSETFFAKQDCNNVRLSVVNLNTNILNVGNDFALDDIQFHPISTVTKVVKSWQKFIVVAHEPKVDVFTAEVVPLPCDGGPAYTVKMHVEFQNPKGRLVIRDITTGIDSLYTVSAPWDKKTDFDRDFIVTTSDPTHEWMAFFEDWPTAQKTTTTLIPGFPKIQAKNFTFSDPIPSCATTTTLSFDLDYTYQQGLLHYSISGLSGEQIQPVKKYKTEQTLSDLTFVNIPADGQVRTLHVTFDGINSCTKDYTLPAAPFSPVIDDVQITGLPKSKLTCSTSSYDINVIVTTHYDATGHTIVLQYNDGKPQIATVPATGTVTTIPLTLHNMDGAPETITASLEEAPACTQSAGYTPPVLARITPLFDVTVGETACGTLNYTLSGDVTFDMPDGDLIVEFDATHRDVIIVASGTTAHFTIPGMTATGTGLTLKAWFTGSAVPACEVESKPFDAPTVPAMDILNTSFSTPGCTETTTTLTFDLQYTYQQGTLTYWVDGIMPKQTAAYTAKDKTANTLTGLTFGNIPADGMPHTLHVEFGHDNGCKDTYTLPVAPFSPVIDDVQITGLPASKLPCSTSGYDINVIVTTHYDATGHNIVLNYNDGKPKMATVPATGTVTTIPLTLHNMDGAPETITASLEEAPACTQSAGYTPPVLARITPLFDVTVGETACGTLNYTLSGDVTFDMPDGDLIVEFDATHRDVITVASGTTAHFTIPGMTATGTGLTLKAWFTGSAVPACEVESKPFDAPTVPAMDILNTSFSTPGCTETTTTLTFDLQYTYQQGTLTYWVDGIMPKQTAAYTAKDKTANTLTGLTFANIPADGTPHTLHVEFGHDNGCKDTYTLPVAPFSPVIDDVQITGLPATVLCEAVNYSANVAIYMPYDMSGRSIVLSYENTSTTIPVSGNPTTTVLTLTTTNATGLSLEAAYSDATGCAVSRFYNAPDRMSCVKDSATICESETYTWAYNNTTYGPFATAGEHIITNDANIHDTLVINVRLKPEISLLPIDTIYEDATGIVLPFSIVKGQPHHFDITIGTYTFTQNYSGTSIVIARPADMLTGDYTAVVTVYDSLISCFTSTQTNFVIAGIPTVSTLTVTPRDVVCGATDYEVDVHMDYMNPRGDLILEDKTNGNTYRYAVPAVAFNTPQTLDTVITIASFLPATLNWEAYFTGWASATTGSTAPTVPAMDTAHVAFNALGCSDLTAALTFDLHYTNQQGTLNWRVDDLPAQTAAYSVADKSQQTLAGLTVTGIPADGRTHLLHVSFDGMNSCTATYVLPQVPVSSVISSFVVSRDKDTVLCDEDSVSVSITFSIPYVLNTPAFVKLTIPGGQEITSSVYARGNKKTFTLSDIKVAIGDAPAVFTAEYLEVSGMHACPVSYSLDMPVRMTCDRDYADICLGDSYSWHNSMYTPASAGVFGYKDQYDSLYLTVHAIPAVTMLPTAMICADANEIRLPYAVSEGTPNLFDIVIDGHSFTQAKSGSETIVLTRPSDIPAGTYTATVTVRDSLVTCFSSAQTRFVIADPDVMYRKWEDLVFIDNSSRLFVGYQWFENGNPIAGATEQYYHNPDGLLGTDSYYCRMITTANDTLYSCETAFDDIVRSKDISNGSAQHITVSPSYVKANGLITISQTQEQPLTIMLFDATGKLIHQCAQNQTTGTMTAPAQEGMYVIRIQDGQDIHTTKIIVHE